MQWIFTEEIIKGPDKYNIEIKTRFFQFTWLQLSAFDQFSSNAACSTGRGTWLCEFSPIGWLFTLCSFFEIAKVAKIFT
jgi:hypothetical protein